MNCIVRFDYEMYTYGSNGQAVGKWFEQVLIFLAIVLATVHDIDFHDIPFAKIISLSHDRVTAQL